MTKKQRIEKYLNTQIKNLEFIKQRIEIQSQPGYTRLKTLTDINGCSFQVSERQYYTLDIILTKEKINKAKKYLNEKRYI